MNLSKKTRKSQVLNCTNTSIEHIPVAENASAIVRMIVDNASNFIHWRSGALTNYTALEELEIVNCR